MLLSIAWSKEVSRAVEPDAPVVAMGSVAAVDVVNGDWHNRADTVDTSSGSDGFNRSGQE